MIFDKKILLLLLFFVYAVIVVGQEKVITVIERGELTQEEIEADPRYTPSDKKKKSKRLPSAFNTFRYEFKTNGNEAQYITIKNEAKKAEESIEIIPVDKVEDLDIIGYNFGYEYHKTKSHNYDIERHYHENYIVYKNRKKYGLVLGANVVPAKFDTIGKPYLLRGEKPMMLVAKKKRGNYKWGIIKSDGSFLLPMEYDEISAPLKMDVAMNSSGTNREDANNSMGVIYPQGLLTDGLYHNHKLIVRKKDKYGLYNANGLQELEVIYDAIEVDGSLGVYTLQKDKESGFLIAKYNKIGVWGMKVVTEKNTKIAKYIKVFPTKDYQIVIKDKQMYIKYNSGILSKIRHDAIMKMIEK